MITLSAEMEAALESNYLRLAYFCEVEGRTSFLRLWSGIDWITWNGLEWKGAGNLASIKEFTETNDLRAAGLEFALSGIRTEQISFALQEVKSGALVQLWLAFLTEAGAVIADPRRVHKGRLDMVQTDLGVETSIITAKSESILVDLERSYIRRFTHEDQQIDYPGDKFFEYVAAIQDKEVLFGG